MSRLRVKFGDNKYADQELQDSICCILDASELCAMATIDQGTSHIHTAYFVYNELLEIFFLSQQKDRHIQNIMINPSISVAIWNSTTDWGENLQGIQIFGSCRQLNSATDLINGMGLYLKRFPAFSTIIKHPGEFADGIASRLYVVKSRKIKLLDEPRFGRRNYLTLSTHLD